jgi:hypothetical protein
MTLAKADGTAADVETGTRRALPADLAMYDRHSEKRQ